MASTAGKNSLVQLSDDSFTTWNDVKANNESLSLTTAMLDNTHFQDDAMKRIPGLKDNPISVSGRYDAADAGQAALVAAALASTLMEIKILPDGTNGFLVSGYFESVELTSAADGTVDYSASFVSDGTASVTTKSV